MSQLTIPQALEQGFQFHKAGRLQEAENIYRQILSVDPKNANAMYLLGMIAAQANQLAPATQLISNAIAMGRPTAEWHHNLALVYMRQGQWDEAGKACEKATQTGGTVDMWNNLGFVRVQQARFVEAGDCFRRALRAQENYPEAHSNLAYVYLRQGRLDEALIEASEAVRLKPDFARAHWHKGLVLLTQGDYTQGWREWVWRGRMPELRRSPRNFPQSMWDGKEDIAGKTVLVNADMPGEDVLMLARYVKVLADKGAKVILECAPELLPVLQGAAGVSSVAPFGQATEAFDTHVALANLPLLMETTLKTVPANVPYLSVAEQAAAMWDANLDAAGTGRRVGLMWMDPTMPPMSPQSRGMSALELGPLGMVNDVKFHLLSEIYDANVHGQLPYGLAVRVHAAMLKTPQDIMALISKLDLVIAVDGMFAQLAAAMGKPTWIMLPAISDWHWLRKREDSPWYPNVRLFRQPETGDWKPVVQRVAEELKALPRIRGAEGSAAAST